ncbi:MAG TPA: transcriptional regulator, partial [Micromonosporaceae bacterium]
RVVDPRDRREVRLRLTAAADEMLDALSDYRRRALAAILMRMPSAARGELGRGLAAFGAATETTEEADMWERTA